MTHKCIVTILRLQDSRRLKVILGETVSNLLNSREVAVEFAEVDVTALNAITVRVESVRVTRLVIRERAKVLGPITQRRGSIHECIGPSDIVGGRKTLKEPRVLVIVGVPPHLSGT